MAHVYALRARATRARSPLYDAEERMRELRHNLARMKKSHCDVWPSGSAMASRQTTYAD